MRCKGCKWEIPLEHLRIARVYGAERHDAFDIEYFCPKCLKDFFQRIRVDDFIEAR